MTPINTSLPALDISIREARPEDAAGLIAFVNGLAEEPDIHIALNPGEFYLTVDQEQQILAEYAEAENSIFLFADAAGTIAGNLNLRGGRRRANRHVCTLGMAVTKGWRRQGIGSLLLKHALDWAQRNPIVKRLELNVFTENEIAIHLYQQFGFTIEGTRRKALYRDGRFHDDYIMAILL